MATTSKRTVKRLARSRTERRRREYLELLQHCWPLLTLRDAHELRQEVPADSGPTECLNVP
jgi:hypothetical protein